MKIPGELVRLKILARKFAVARYLKSNPTPKIHIGCGDHIFDGWLNCDKFMAEADIYLNVYSKFPFKDNLFDKAYSEHLIEHLNVDKVQHFLGEIFRILKPGGMLRITCPDFEKFAEAYIKGDTLFYSQIMENFSWKRKSHPDLTWVLRSNAGAMVGYIVKDYFNHKWMYDFKTLESCLREVGFSKVIRQEFQQGLDEESAALDGKAKEFESLYVDAVK